jgi:hypothetical protein
MNPVNIFYSIDSEVYNSLKYQIVGIIWFKLVDDSVDPNRYISELSDLLDEELID